MLSTPYSSATFHGFVPELCRNLINKSVRGTVTEKRENEFIKKKEHLIYKFNKLQTTSCKGNKQQFIYVEVVNK